MASPYKVKVTSKGKDDIHVKVSPEPIAKQGYQEHVTQRVSEVLLQQSITNSMIGRLRLKNQLSSVLEQLHVQGFIEPKKEKDEGNL